MGGAGSVAVADRAPLQGRDVIVWPDADHEGKKAADTLVKRLAGIAARDRVVRVDDLPNKDDAADAQWTPADFEARLIEPGSGGPALELPRLIDLRSLPTAPPPPAFIVPDWLPAGEVALFAGHGTGKSAIALYRACCVALGRPFFGLPTVRRRVLLLAAEDTQAVTHWRLTRLAVHMGFEVAGLADWLTIADATGADAELLTETRDGAALTHVYEWLRQRMADHEVLILDGASDTFGACEINRRQVRQFVRGASPGARDRRGRHRGARGQADRAQRRHVAGLKRQHGMVEQCPGTRVSAAGRCRRRPAAGNAEVESRSGGRQHRGAVEPRISRVRRRGNDAARQA